MKRFLAIVMILAMVALSLPQDTLAKAKKKAAPETADKRYAAIVVDAATGAVLSEKNADKALYPASLTKVMTLMLLFEQLENGTIRLNDRITISAHAASQQPSKLGLSAGSSIRIEDAVLAIVTKSANDISAALAEHIAGSEERFALRMTRRARDIGMARTTYVNASGLPDTRQISSARDQAILARYILTRYPNYYRYFGTKQFTYRGKTHTNHNRLMSSYPGMDGFKTGFINASGFNLIASARRDGRRLIGVVFGGRSWKSRNDRMAVLLDEGFKGKSGQTQLAAVSEKKEDAIPVVRMAEPQKDDLPRPEPKPVLKQTDGAGNIQPAQKPEASGALSAPKPSLKTALAPEPYLTAPAVKNTGHVDTAYAYAAPAPANTLQLPPSYYANQAPAARYAAPLSAPAQPAYEPQQAAPISGGWSVQIGAYNSREATDDALNLAKNRLPQNLSHATPLVVPLTSGEGVLYRARLGGLSAQEASQICGYFRDCLPVSP